MKHYSFFIICLVLLFATTVNFAQSFQEIPESFLTHPELGILTHQSQTTQSQYELVQLRSENSRTFLNQNKTKTTVTSSSPLHYLDENGWWLSIDYKLTEKNNQLIFPSKKPSFIYDKNLKTTDLISKEGLSIKSGKNLKLIFVDEENNPLKTLEKNSNIASTITTGNQLSINNFFPDVDVDYTFYDSAFKSNYTLQNNSSVNLPFHSLIIEEILEVPLNYELKHELFENQKTHRLLILDEKGNPTFIYQQPVVTDSREIESKFRHLYEPHIARYHFEKIDNTHYKIQIQVDANWLKSNERVFPVIIDPIVTIENTNIVNSCFFPNYQQSSIFVTIPSGEDVLQTQIEYDFIASPGSDAWMSDQRSFVTGPNGSTPVFSGTGDTEGTYTYQINNSPVGNGTSTGQVEYVFNFSRTWGGSGCNATFNFVNRRTLEVLHDTIIYGDGPIFINEYSASNMTHLDGFGRTEDWIELYNASPDTFFNLEGYFLSNDIENPTLWQIESGLIPPNSKVIVYASKRDIASGTVFHANFNLTQLRPDQIVLANPQGEIMEALEMHTTQVNHSYGRTEDGGSEWGLFASPTPGTSNNTTSYITYSSTPTFSLQAGHYHTSVNIALTSTGNNEEIRYTTDGSTPTETSTLYTQPIPVNQTTSIRAGTFSSDPEFYPGFIETNTYFINENHTIPIFSFSGDGDLLDLFNGDDSLRPYAHFEYFESNGEFIDENFGDFNKHGNDSWNYPQRGVDFISRDEFGYNRRLEHQFFSTSDRTRFRRLMVKAAANDNYPFENGGAHIRDSYIQTLSQLSNLDLDERSSTNVIVYVNGEYWGVYDLRERVDDNNFTDYYYGQDYTYRESDIFLQFIKTWGTTEAHFGNAPALQDFNSLVQYIQNNNMGDPAHFNYVDSQLNINSLIDYFVINSYVVSRDWLNYNTGWWRGTNPAGQAQKWRYILWDMEAALGHFHNYTGLPNTSETAPPCQAEDLQPGNPHTTVIKKLIQENQSVRNQYITRYSDLLNTHLSSERVIQVLDSMVANISPEMPRQIQRWGGNINTWEANVQNVRDFLLDRNDYILSQGLANCYDLTGPFATNFNVFPENSGKIKMNSEWLENFPFTAQIFGNIETYLIAEANPGFVFSHWVVDGAVVFPDVNSLEIELMISQATEVTAHFEDPSQSDDILIYYWHYNDLDTPEDVTTIEADFKLFEDASPLMTYTGSGPRDIDAVNEGSDLNIHQSESSGIAARVRNPSQNRSLVFDLPTTGFKDIKFTYAVMRTNNGQLQNILSYSTDGTNFIQTGLNTTTFDVETDFQLIHLDFTDIETVNDNPDFKIKIDFEGNTTNTNGNNRFDNITLKGVDINLTTEGVHFTGIQIYPNPFDNYLNIINNQNIQQVMVYDMLGKLIFNQKNINNNKAVLDLNQLTQGVYLLKIYSENSVKTHKIVKK